MAIGLALSGVRSMTGKNLVLDAAVMYSNININQLEVGDDSAFADAVDSANTFTDPDGNTVAPGLLGATRGGVTINIQKTERQVEVDSRRVPVKGFSRVDEINPIITTNLIEFGDPDVMELFLGSSTRSSLGDFIKLVPKLIVADEDYLANVAAAVTINGEDQPMLVVLSNPRVTNPGELGTADKSEMGAPVTFMGHALASSPLSVPIAFYIPDETQS